MRNTSTHHRMHGDTCTHKYEPACMDTLWVYHVCINTVVPPRPPPKHTHCFTRDQSTADSAAYSYLYSTC